MRGAVWNRVCGDKRKGLKLLEEGVRKKEEGREGGGQSGGGERGSWGGGEIRRGKGGG